MRYETFEKLAVGAAVALVATTYVTAVRRAERARTEGCTSVPYVVSERPTCVTITSGATERQRLNP